MGVVSFIADRLTNVMSGMGTSIDKRTGAFYHFVPLDPASVEAAYRTSWLNRKIVDIPPLDMTRAWRAWQTDKTAIELLEAEEKRLKLKHKAKQALTLARLWGGSAIIIGAQNEAPEEELRVDAIKKGGLEYLHVLGRHQITPGPIDDDITSEWFGRPEYFQIGTGSAVRLHPSRVVEFVGHRPADGGYLSGADPFWGDPILQSIEQAVMNADLAQDGFAGLINEAKLDILKIPGLMANIGTAEYQTKLTTRLAAAQTGKSTWRAMVIDGEEEWEQKQVTWTGMPDVINTYLQIVSGAADIPVTRLLGQSPKGLQSTGDGERKDYHDMIAARQDEVLAPALERIDEVLIRSAMGSRPSDIWFKFNSLEQMDPEQAAKIEDMRAKSLNMLATTGLFSDEALSKLGQNALIESGSWPGAEAAFEESAAPDFDEPDPDDALTEEERLARQAEEPDESEA
jgi:phage-related protein (TIGR01555 family)